ncbi:hypothetical protein SDC9_138591 [bioreactor metagenome]|uniref:Uncharacterized protein n=1 Tax=bioreactor metagenome TaxID=1076179 RepID=A0A645DSN5_9ZZZZ
MVVLEPVFPDDGYSPLLQGSLETLGASDGGKGEDGAGSGASFRTPASVPPPPGGNREPGVEDFLLRNVPPDLRRQDAQLFGRNLVRLGDHHQGGPGQFGGRFPKYAGRGHPPVPEGAAGVHQGDIHIPGHPPVLEGVIGDDELNVPVRKGFDITEPVLGYRHGNAPQPGGQQQRFVPHETPEGRDVVRAEAVASPESVRGQDHRVLGRSAVPPADDPHRDSRLEEHAAEHFHEGSLVRPAQGYVPYTDHGKGRFQGRNEAVVVGEVPEGDHGPGHEPEGVGDPPGGEGRFSPGERKVALEEAHCPVPRSNWRLWSLQ